MSLPNIPIVDAATLYVQDLNISFASTTTLGVTAGRARNSTDVNDIILPAAVVINGRTSGVVNALDIGTLAANTLYAVYVIGDSNGYNAAGAVISTSFTQPTLPFGYDMFRRIGAVRTNGTAAPNTLFLDFTSRGDGVERDYWYAAAIATAVTAGNATTFTEVLLTGFVPPVASVAVIKATLTPGTAGDSVALRSHDSSSAAGQDIMSADVVAIAHTASMRCPYSVTALGVSSLDYLVSSAGDAVALSVFGYKDRL